MKEFSYSTNKNNVYIESSKNILRRILWDFNFKSWSSRDILNSYKDKFSKQKAIVVCNGPSLLKANLDQLDNIHTFGLNKINYIFEKSKFRPSFIVSINPFVIEQNSNFFNHTEIPLFLDSRSHNFIRNRKNICYLYSTQYPTFAKDISHSVWAGFTVTFAALELAYHMGFEKVALIGCDHNFETKGSPNKVVASSTNDPNHFDPRYFSGGEKWQLPDLPGSEFAYSMAKEVYQENGRIIYNATEGGNLHIFPRISLDNFMNNE